MPASYTHQCFGDDLLRYMNSDHKTLIKQYKNLFNLGLQGPDLLFYYHPLKKNRVQDIGIKMHQLPARSFFEESFQFDDDATLVYLIGFALHYLLDSGAHPVINKVTHDDFEHYELERDLDMRFLSDRHPAIMSTAASFIADQQASKTIGRVLHITDKEAHKAIKSFRFYNNLVYNEYHDVRMILKKLTALAHIPFTNMFVVDKPSTKYVDDVKEVRYWYMIALREAIEIMPQFIDAYYNKKSLSERFDHNYE
ncbi:MAG TPA: hypothetical protein DDW60_02560 [Kandleria vitulina]|nr:hypothetical protein [Kandleria vitulina]